MYVYLYLYTCTQIFVYGCVYENMYVFVYVRAYVYVYLHACICVYVRIRIFICVYLKSLGCQENSKDCIHLYIYVNFWMYTCNDIRIYVYMYAYIYTYIYTYMYMYTHIYIDTNFSRVSSKVIFCLLKKLPRYSIPYKSSSKSGSDVIFGHQYLRGDLYCRTLQHTATHRNTLQLTEQLRGAFYCNTL